MSLDSCTLGQCTGAGGLCVTLQSMDSPVQCRMEAPEASFYNAILRITLLFSLFAYLAVVSRSLAEFIMSSSCCVLGCALLTNTHFSANIALQGKCCRIGIIVPSLQHPAQLYCALEDNQILSVKYLGVKLWWRVCSFVWRI